MTHDPWGRNLSRASSHTHPFVDPVACASMHSIAGPSHLCGQHVSEPCLEHCRISFQNPTSNHPPALGPFPGLWLHSHNSPSEICSKLTQAIHSSVRHCNAHFTQSKANLLRESCEVSHNQTHPHFSALIQGELQTQASQQL